MPALFVTLQQAKDHLRITTAPGDPDDPDLIVKLNAAELTVLRYISKSTRGEERVSGWVLDPSTAPDDLRAMVLIQFGEFWRFRGDDAGGDSLRRDPDEISAVVRALARRFTDPVLA